MALAPGTRIGAYEILGPLGTGGMGEVYRARDTALGRDVAIKVLPPGFARDTDRLTRFEREARVLASLNHPHIAAIYGVEQAPPTEPGYSGTRALVLELIDGAGLDERIGGRGLPVAEACAIALQIADALDAAHERGIVHRDLKPANVRLTPDAVVKVLDFGVAKHVDRVDDAAANDATALDQTSPGVVVGTVPYMSPEQARGTPVDKRTDIWAFGCVLYEMLSGRQAFAGATASDTIAAILEREPNWDSLPPATPATVRRLLMRCLEKDPKRRLRDIADARHDLDLPALGQGGAGLPATLAAPSRQLKLAWAIAAAAIGVAAWAAMPGTGPSFQPPPEFELSQLTLDSGISTTPALSRDGRLLAYASTRAGRNDLDVWIQQSAGGLPLRLTDNAADERNPDIAPDGSQVVFRSERDGGGAYIVPALGGPARLVAQGALRPRFSPDGRRIAYFTGQFRGGLGRSSTFILSLSGGTPERLLDGFAVAQQPTWAPDGRSLLVLAALDRAPIAEGTADIDLWRVPLDGGSPARTHLLDRPGWRDAFGREAAQLGTWSDAGLLLGQRGSLWSVPLDAATGAPSAEPRRLLLNAAPVRGPTGTATDLVVFEQGTSERVIERAALAGGRALAPAERLYSDGNATTRRASTSRDGQVIVFERGNGGAAEIWVKDLRTGVQQLVHRVESVGGISATISSDGRRIAYNRNPGAEVGGAPGTGYVVDVDGGVPQAVCENCRIWGFMPDSGRVIATIGDRTIGVIDVPSGARTEILTDGEARMDRPSVSPDGRWIAFRRQAGNGGKTHLSPLARATVASAIQIDEPTTTGRPAGWSPDSRVLYLLLDTDGFRCLWGQQVDPQTGRLAGKPTIARHLHDAVEVSSSLGNAVTAEGFLYEAMSVRSSLWRLTPAAPR